MSSEPIGPDIGDQVAGEDIDSQMLLYLQLIFTAGEFVREQIVEFLVLVPLPDVGRERDPIRNLTSQYFENAFLGVHFTHCIMRISSQQQSYWTSQYLLL
jgi:hypothetical protein